MEALFPRQAESLVTGLLNKLSELAVQELGLLLGVRDEIRYITEELEMMQAFLRHAEEEESSNPVAGAWVNQVREVVFLAEDCIDDFTLHVSKPDSQNWLAGLRGRVGSLTSVKARHRIAAQIQDIKSRVEEVSERRLRYGLTGTSQGSTSTTRLAQYDPRQAALFVDDLQLVGIDGPRETIVRCLLEEGEPAGLHAISIVGMGGLGKTTLARKVYQDRRVSTGGSFPSRAWIVVSQPFNKSVFLRNMLDNLSPTGTDGLSDEQLIQKIQGLLREKRYVIVFDDVWTVDAWESIRLVLPTPCNNRSRIIVTTRNETVAYTCCPNNQKYVYKLQPLSTQQSFDLFCRRVFEGPNHTCPPQLEDLSKSILKKCGGLPLAIVTIGGLLASKPNKTEQEWKKIINHLGSELESNPSLEGMKHVLTLSYNDLPYPVKRCFLYLSIFPEDHEIRRKHLQTLWIAEGLIVKGHRGADSEEEVAEAYFNELIARSMILPSSFSAADGRVKSFRVHDVMLELIVSKSAEYNFVSVLGEHHSPAGIIRRLSVHGGGGPSSTDYSLESMDLSHVRTYSTFGVADPKYLVSSCRRLRLLTVLDLQGCNSLFELREISKFRHLVYLSLRGTNIRSLPESIGKLQKLETLDIRYSSIDLPANIVKIRRLRVLRAGDRFPSVYPPSIPRRFGRLERLQTMADVAISHRGMAEELRKLRRLRKLGLVLRTTDAKDCCTSLGNLSTGLRSLRIVFYWSNLIADNLSNLEAVSPPPLLLHTLGLAGDLSGLPSWVSQLNNVVKIKLYETGLRNDAIQVLQSLPSLVQLSLLHDSYMEENLSFGGQGQFSALKVLRLVRLQQLKSLRFSGGAMPKLERLFIGGCPLEGGEDEGINYLPRLKEILVSDLPDQVFHRLQEATQAHHNHPTFNPYVGRM